MPLTAGTMLGPYEIVEPIGSGGMGEVYRARDPRIGRDVAIKVSAEAFSDRFSREARAVASLNHPNICSLYDVGPNYLVMEFVEGENLEGPLPLPTVLNYARQIAAALEAAHDKTVVHRDLKPGNIMIKRDGLVKVLDFGLAKMGGVPAAPSDNSPTLTMRETQAGTILGTAAYMAPEQAKGKQVDHRADIWAFGAVVWEAATGRRLFRGETITEVLASVMKEEPRWDEAPPQLRRLLRKCLERDPEKRLKHIGDAMALVDDGQDSAALARAASGRARWGWIAAAVAALAAGTLAFIHFRESPPVASTVRFQVRPPEKSSAAFFRLSPDGQMMVIADTLSRKLMIRAMDAVEYRTLDGTEGARYPFWSPDSANIAFFADGKLKKVPVNGGSVQILCDATDGRGGSWNTGGVIVFSPDPTVPLARVNSTGGVPVQITKISSDGEDHRFPEFLPDQHHYLYTVNSPKSELNGIYVGLLEGGTPVRVLPDVSSAEFTPTPGGNPENGHILFRRGNVLMAAPFDAKRLRVTGDVFPVAQNVGISANVAYAAFSAANNGVLAHSYEVLEQRELVWVDRQGKRLGALGPPQSISSFALSPDEKTAAYVVNAGGGRSDVWLYDLSRNSSSRFTFGPGGTSTPLWSPDGKWIAYGATRTAAGEGEILRKPASGGAEQLLARSGALGTQLWLFDWAPDGKSIVFTPEVSIGTTRSDLILLPLEGDRKAVPYLKTNFEELQGQFSPDGRWMAYSSDESGSRQVDVQPVPATGAKWQVSTAGGSEPRWSRNGKEMFYIAPGNRLMAVSVKFNPAFEAGAPQELFQAVTYNGTYDFGYLPSKDGKKFLLLSPAASTAPSPPISMVLNWQAGIKK